MDSKFLGRGRACPRLFADTWTLLDVHRGTVGQLIEQQPGNFVAALRIGKCEQHGILFRLPYLRSVAGVDPQTMRMLEQYAWPGNVRELRNVIERATILSGGPFIEPKHLPPALTGEPPRQQQPQVALGPGVTVAEAERRLILMTLEHTRDNKTRAAEILGISLKTLHNKLNKLRLRNRKADQ